jgi:hypothetical protein
MTHDQIKTFTECGARVDGERVFVGNEQVHFSTAGSERLGCDGFAVTRTEGHAEIVAASEAARFSAILELAEMQERGVRQRTRALKFKTRNYKHELSFWPHHSKEHLATSYTEEFWSAVCRELVRRHFNGIVFYAWDGALDRLLDFDRFADVVELSARERERNRTALNMLLRVSRRYGLRTFLQQYITHFPAQLAAKLHLPFRAFGKPPQSTMSYFKHPVIDDYSRYCYRRLFELCPNLDGLYLNFESAPNCFEFIDDVVLPTLSRLPKPPTLLFRTWYLTNPQAFCDRAKRYPGPTMLGEKIMDTIDTYNFPAADTHIVEWQEAFARNRVSVDYNYLIGPCHNCGSGISRSMWSDPELIYTTLGKVEKLGGDGLSFHTVFELLADEFDSSKVISPPEREMARLNHFHLESLVDFVRGGKFNESRVISAHAEHFGLKRSDAAQVCRALRDSSRAVTLPFLQFPLTTQEGYCYDAKRSFVQHPFFILPASQHNDDYRKDPHQWWSWVNRTKKSSAYPNDLQTVIDYVDPSKPKTKRNPAVISREILRLAENPQRAARGLHSKMGELFLQPVVRITTSKVVSRFLESISPRAELRRDATSIARWRSWNN